MSIEDRKAYVEARVIMPGIAPFKTKLVVDLGAGHPVSIERYITTYGLPQKFIASANLGIGLNGPINGFISRMDEFDLGKFRLKKVLASFPDDRNNQANLSVKRDGNLGVGILKRFNVILDYPDSALYLKPGSTYNDPFEHDMSGLEYYAAGDHLERIVISRVEPGSAADEVGLEHDDEIISINFKPVSRMSLQDIDELFKSKDDRSLLLEVYHDKRVDNVVLTLKRRI
jgi:S1-C subfamily serine protease